MLQKYKNNRRERKNFPFKKEIIAVFFPFKRKFCIFTTESPLKKWQNRAKNPLKNVHGIKSNHKSLENRCLNEKSRNISKNGKVMSTNSHSSPLHGFPAEKQIIFVKISES